MIVIRFSLTPLFVAVMLSVNVCAQNCPPPGFDALQTFDIDSYISDSWYAVKQIPLSYQPIEDFFCVRADYIRDTSRCLFCLNSVKVQVYNQARNGSVNGTIGGTPYSITDPPAKGLFRAFQRRPDSEPAKLTVGFLSNFALRANYWVVAAGTYEDAISRTGPIPTSTQYDWAIISGGLADKETENGKCIPNPGVTDFLGMWMFARDGVPPAGVIDGIEEIASIMGLDTTKWLPVVQEGCIFEE